MKMIEDGYVRCIKDNEYGFYTVGKTYKVRRGFITDNRGEWTNFSNVKKFFIGVIVP